VGKSAGINIVFDENFRDVPFTMDISGQTFEGALKGLCQATKNFYRIIDERTVIIVPDQPLKRIQYEINCIGPSTFPTSWRRRLRRPDPDAADPIHPAMIIFDKSLNTVSVRGTPEIVELADKLIRTWDKPKGEVIIDLEIMEVSRVKLRQLGLDFENNYAGLRYGCRGTRPTRRRAGTASRTSISPSGQHRAQPAGGLPAIPGVRYRHQDHCPAPLAGPLG